MPELKLLLHFFYIDSLLNIFFQLFTRRLSNSVNIYFMAACFLLFEIK